MRRSPDIAVEWMGDANCKDRGELFYAPSNERNLQRANRERLARVICGACEVRTECLDYALAYEDHPYVFGIWGGMTEDERRKIVRRRSRAG